MRALVRLSRDLTRSPTISHDLPRPPTTSRDLPWPPAASRRYAKRSVVTAFAFSAVFPLALLQNLHYLRYTSTVAVCMVLYVVACLAIHLGASWGVHPGGAYGSVIRGTWVAPAEGTWLLRIEANCDVPFCAFCLHVLRSFSPSSHGAGG